MQVEQRLIMDYNEFDENIEEENLAEEIQGDDNDTINTEEDNRHHHEIPGEDKAHRLTGMYKNWFLDYASYVILERAVPHMYDGLKPVQRRILHAMRELDDGRYNKVANVVGHTMQYHPHGDASIAGALVQYIGRVSNGYSLET